jgi:hypothetical protein
MKTGRIIIGLLIIVFIGLPMLLGTIWTVGVTRGVVSPDFVSELPKEILSEAPDLVDRIFEEARDEDLIGDSNTRAWFEAAAETGVKPSDLFREIGLLGWFENEVSVVLENVADVLSGKRRARPMTLDLRPLRSALEHPALENYIRDVLNHLPVCDESTEGQWVEALRKDLEDVEIPACRPDVTLTSEIVDVVRDHFIEGDMDDEVEIFSDLRVPHFGIAKMVQLVSYGLFFLPILFLLIGSLIAGQSSSSVLKWGGGSLLFGGLISLGLSYFVQNISSLALKFNPCGYEGSWTNDLEMLIYEKIEWIPSAILDHVFSPVVKISGIVCIIGLIIFAISFTMRSQTRG